MHSQGSVQLLPEVSNELGSLVRNDSLQRTMQAQDARNIKLSILLSPVEGCRTPFRDKGNEASIRVPRMFKSHV
jgi:hypothetical protein